MIYPLNLLGESTVVVEMKPIKITVVMTTYNGSKYILQQLESIKMQTKLPNEVVILDDKSTDGTFELIKTFIDSNNLTNWSIRRNSKNLGWKKNFYESACLATGDIIFYSDQDDVWLPNKIQKMTSIMTKNKIGVLFADKVFINSEGSPCLDRMTKKNFSSKLKQIPFQKSFYSIKVQGCCMCVSRDVLNRYIKLGFSQGDHDSQCCRLALLYSSLWYLDEALIKYRVHGNNASGISAKRSFGTSTLNNRIESIENIKEWLCTLRDKGDKFEYEFDVNKCIEALNYRIEYLQGNKKILFPFLLRYRDYYSDLTMLFGDFAYKHHVNDILGKIRWFIKKK